MSVASWVLSLLLVVPAGGRGVAAPVSAAGAAATSQPAISVDLPKLDNPQEVSGGMKWLLLLTVMSVAPAFVVLITSFTRIVVVLGLLRQALATQNTPPNSVLFGLALLMTAVIMGPIYQDVNRDAIAPYVAGQMTSEAAIAAGETHVRGFMIRQIEASGNGDDVYPFLPKELAQKKGLAWRDVPTLSLVPGFVVSELKVAFTIGFRIFLPFLILDLLVASVLTSLGMLMVPPVLISLPFKLLLFVLADGWNLVVGTLMRSFG